MLLLFQMGRFRRAFQIWEAWFTRGGAEEGKEGRRVDELANAPSMSYTIGMKVAVSIPDPIFEEAERLARRLGTSRSEVYARALNAFAAAHAPDRVTEALNEAVEAAGEAGPDEFTREAARRTLQRSEW